MAGGVTKREGMGRVGRVEGTEHIWGGDLVAVGAGEMGRGFCCRWRGREGGRSNLNF